MANLFRRLAGHAGLNFLVTNRIPRHAATRLMGWVSRIDSPALCAAGVAIWRQFTDLDLAEAKPAHYRCLRDVFTRELRPGARPVSDEPGVLVSPCDAIVGACGDVAGTEVFQAKGFPYRLEDLLGQGVSAAPYRNGTYATLRLTSAMYHRFHAPGNARIRRVTYYSGDTWNVNPVALKRVERLFCRNERAAIELQLAGPGDASLLLVPVAAILVASIRLHFANVRLHLRYRGPNVIDCDVAVTRGEELGWFEHGSTILVFAPPGFRLHESISSGRRLRMGEPLLRTPA